MLGAVLAAAFLSPADAQLARDAGPVAVDQSLAPYASTANSVRLPDGRTLHLVCMGEGSPTVILNPGGDAWSIMWNKVQPEAAKKTRVCAWDRQALGLSSAGPQEPDIAHSAQDLDAALKAAGIAGPFVAVGHSLGGYDSLLFADRHRADMAGMVLVDPTPLTDPAAPDPATPQINAIMSGEPPFLGLLRRCAAGLRDGMIKPGAPDPDGCLNPPPPPPDYPPELRDAMLALRAGATAQATAMALDNIAYYNSGKRIADDGRAAWNPARNYGDMPLIVLSAGDAGIDPRNPPEINAELPALLAGKKRVHAQMAALSTRGVHRVVEGSPHDIPHAKPEAVIDAIDEVVQMVRSAGHITPHP